MDFTRRNYPLLILPLIGLHLLSSHAQSTDEKGGLLQNLNSYRASLNLSSLTDNNNADCLAHELAKQFKDQSCSNTTGSNMIPGTEPQLPNFPDLLTKCHLNMTNTRDGPIMPVCVPNLVPSLVLTNFTQTQYSQYLNDSTYTGAGIGSEGDWAVVVLSTDTAGGSFTPAQNAASLVSRVNLLQYLMYFLLGLILVLLS